MKKILALLMAVTLVIGAAVLPALAEGTDGTTDSTTSATVTGKGGRGGNRQLPGNGQMPQTPGQNGQMPQMPGQNGQMPQMPGQNGQNTQPDQNQQPGKGIRGGNRGYRAGKHFDLDQLLADGVITQEVYDAITNYMKENAPQAQADAAPAEGTEPPALPDGTVPAEGSELPAAPEGEPGAEELQLLNDLLESGAITQEQYDTLTKNIAAPAPAANT